MKNSDFIQMNQCSIYSIKFPTNQFVETVESLRLDGGEYFNAEVITNPMTGKKVHKLENGFFFTLRINFKKLTKELISGEVFELKQKASDETKDQMSEKEWVAEAKSRLFATVPDSVEVVNVFYSPEKELLIANKSSNNCKTVLILLIERFGMAGFRSIVVLEEKHGLTTRLQNYLTDYTPMFKHLRFENEAALRKQSGEDEAFLLCRHLNDEEKRQKAHQALEQGYKVRSVLMEFNDGKFQCSFKLDAGLKIRNMKFDEYRDVASQLNGHKVAAKGAIMVEYLDRQFEMLLKIAESTVLEFVQETELENFV